MALHHPSALVFVVVYAGLFNAALSASYGTVNVQGRPLEFLANGKMLYERSASTDQIHALDLDDLSFTLFAGGGSADGSTAVALTDMGFVTISDVCTVNHNEFYLVDGTTMIKLHAEYNYAVRVAGSGTSTPWNGDGDALTRNMDPRACAIHRLNGFIYMAGSSRGYKYDPAASTITSVGGATSWSYSQGISIDPWNNVLYSYRGGLPNGNTIYTNLDTFAQAVSGAAHRGHMLCTRNGTSICRGEFTHRIRCSQGVDSSTGVSAVLENTGNGAGNNWKNGVWSLDGTRLYGTRIRVNTQILEYLYNLPQAIIDDNIGFVCNGVICGYNISTPTLEPTPSAPMTGSGSLSRSKTGKTSSPDPSDSSSSTVTGQVTLSVSGNLSETTSLTVRQTSTASVPPTPTRSPEATTSKSLSASDSLLPSLLTSCRLAPLDVFDDEPFDVEFSGGGITEKDRVALIEIPVSELFYYLIGNRTHDCSRENISSFVEINNVNRAGNFGYFRTSVTASVTPKAFVVCYAGAARVGTKRPAEQCPFLAFRSKGAAPWSTVNTVLGAAARPLTELLSLQEFNMFECESLMVSDPEERQSVFLQERAAVLLDARGGETLFGTPVEPHQTNEVCAVVIDPYLTWNDTYPTPRTSVAITLGVELLGEDVSILVFSGVAAPVFNASIPEDHAERHGGSCPTTLVGQYLWHYERRAGDEGKRDVRVPLGPATLILCSGVARTGGRSLRMSYRMGRSMCPNDCRDGEGELRGECDEQTQRCACHPQWQGDDCSVFTGCARGANAPVITGSGRGIIRHRIGDEVASQASEPFTCGFLLVPDNTYHEGRRGPMGIGVMLGAVGTMESYNCEIYNVRFLANSHDGPELLRWCRTDLERLRGMNDPWLVVNRSDPLGVPVERVYVEMTLALEDAVDLEYSSVALTCPGSLGPSFFVEDECSGHGTCVEFEYNQRGRGLRDSTRMCLCDTPFGSMWEQGTCNTCDQDHNRSTFPVCEPLAVCPDDCSCNGVCMSDGCVCDEGFFGRACNYRLDEVEFSDALVLRNPFDNGTSGNAENAGTVDRSTVSCDLDVSCLPISRQRGRQFPAAVRSSCSGGGGGRRQAGSANTTVTTTRSTGAFDYGYQLNKLQWPGSIGDLAAERGIAGGVGDVTGSISVVAWVQLTGSSNGWLYAKTDDARDSFGGFPVLDDAVGEVRDRHARARVLDGEALRVYFGIYVNGAQKSLEVMMSRPSGDGGVTEIAVRHFRLGDDATVLFDGTWRYLAFVYDEDRGRGQVYVDGRTDTIDPNYVQCFPFSPTEVSSPATVSGSSRRVARYTAGGASVVGYRLLSNIDEFRLYSEAVAHVTIVKIGSTDFERHLAEDRGALISMATIGLLAMCAACCVCGVRALRWRSAATTAAADEAVDDAENVASAPEQPATSVDVDIWVGERVQAPAESDVGDAVLTLQNAVELVVEHRKIDREQFLSRTFVEVETGVWRSTLAGSAAVSTDGNAGIDVEAKASAGDEVDSVGKEDAPVESAEAPREMAIDLGVVEAEAKNDDATDDNGSPLESSPASPISVKHVFMRSRRGSRSAFPHPDPFDPTTWDVFLSDAVAPKPVAALRLCQWLVRRFCLEGGDPTLPDIEILALLLEQRADAFVNEHHGKASWAEHPDVGELQRQLAVFAVMRSCRSHEELEAFRQQLSAAASERESNPGLLAEQSRAALAACELEDPQEKSKNRRLLALATATLMIGQSGALTQATFRVAFANAIGGEGCAIDDLLLDATAAEAEAVFAGRAVVKGRYLFSLLGGWLQRVWILRDFWQIVALLIGIMTFPAAVSTTLGRMASVVSISFSSSSGAGFEANFILCCTLGMLAFVALLVAFVLEMLAPAGPRRLEHQLRLQLRRQALLVGEGKLPTLRRTLRERVVQLFVLLLTTMYLPTTRIVLMGIFCHEDVLCLYDCYQESRHKAIVGVGVVVLLCVTIASPMMLWVVTAAKQREFASFVGHAALADRRVTALGHQTQAHSGPTADQLWSMFTVVNTSPFASIYRSFRLRWGQFAVVLLVVKAVYALIAIATPPNTTAQVVSLVLLQVAFTAGAAVVTPYRFRTCSVMLTGAQIIVLLLLSLHSAYRVDPDASAPAIGGLQLAVLSIAMVLHVPALLARDDGHQPGARLL